MNNRRNAIELLPGTADAAINSARAALLEQRRTQLDIHAEFSRALMVLDLKPVSLAAFNRWSLKVVGRPSTLERLTPKARAALSAFIDAIREE
ncbi:hypothetical protein [Mesorhizobium sp. 2RAF21]|uniref:hypothetical protein n=1 Tax=Mesorhizobium sp. 2RAF21 TaxID=3232995 RepID=UPI003F99A897